MTAASLSHSSGISHLAALRLTEISERAAEQNRREMTAAAERKKDLM